MPAIVWLSLAITVAVLLPVGTVTDAFLTVALGVPFAVAMILSVLHLKRACPFCIAASYKVTVPTISRRVQWCRVFHTVLRPRLFRIFIIAEFALVLVGTTATIGTGDRYYAAGAYAVLFLSTAVEAAAIHHHQRLIRYCVWCAKDGIE